MGSKDELAHLECLDELRGEFPVYNNRNSPRIIALAKETATQTNGSPAAATGTAPPSNKAPQKSE